jgi:hypothetical protein
VRGWWLQCRPRPGHVGYSSPVAEETLTSRANGLAEAVDADVLVYNGDIERPFDDEVIDLSGKRRRRKNLLLFITTFGGDPSAAYRIARCLRARYAKVTAVVPGYCKSAGTLLVLGADELVMFDHAELGPLDIQLRKDDEWGERSSGLAPTQAFLSLDVQVRESVKYLMFALKGELLLTTKTASDLATRIVSNLYTGIYAQFDPMRLGEIQRAQAIMVQYGRRLLSQSHIADQDALAKLTSGYPTHGFVIDRLEAIELFPEKGKVREPTEAECALEALYHATARTPVDGTTKPITFFLNDEVSDARTDETSNRVDGADGQPSDAGTASTANEGGGSTPSPRARSEPAS